MKLLLIEILVFGYIIEQVLDYLNQSNLKKSLPAELQGIYDNEKYEQSQAYTKTNANFGIITSTFSLIIMLIMIAMGGFNYINTWVVSHADNLIVQNLLFFGVLFIVNDIISMPFEWYSTFRIEEQYGFNKTTVKTSITF